MSITMKTFISFVVCLLLLSGCVNSQQLFPVDENGPVGPWSSQELAVLKKQLIEFDASKPADAGMHGGVLIDGTVVNLMTTQAGLLKVTMNVDDILFDEKHQASAKIDVLVSARDKVIVKFRKFKKYRIYVISMHEKFYTMGPLAIGLNPSAALSK